MIYEHCHRCHAALPQHEDGELIYCSHCGTPQLELSEELHSQIEQLAAQDAGADVAPGAQEFKTGDPLWAGAIRYAGLAVAVSAVLTGLATVLPVIGGLSFLWTIASPVVVIGMFHRRYPSSRITPGFGARVGMVTGLGIAVTMLAGNAIELIMMRRSHAPDFVAAWVSQMKQQPGSLQNADIMQWIDKLNTIPEYRAGLTLMALGFGVGLLLMVTTAAGAFAGFARSRQRA